MSDPFDQLADERILVTGARGSIGEALMRALARADVYAVASDLTTCDVRDLAQVEHVVWTVRPTVVFHLAAAKHAPEGEADPWAVTETNVTGTWNVLRALEGAASSARVVTASTCKACDPETAYGASKLIAERMTLNAGGSVARFYNVRESSGNVFRIWEQLPPDEPLPVTPCSRYFVSIADAVALLLWAAILEPGRYCLVPGESEPMLLVAARTYPGRAVSSIPPRRGDRIVEPLLGSREKAIPTHVAGVVRVESPHDCVPVAA